MAVELIVAGLLLTGLLYASSLLARNRQPKNRGEDTPPTLSTRGSWVPTYWGKRLTDVTIVGWVGNRRTKKVKSGGKGFGSGGASQTLYFEDVWHILGVGPATKLHQIRFNNKIVWEGEINSITTPSGTSIKIPGKGTLWLWWGEADQPLNDKVANAMGVNSRWPKIVNFYWQRLELGTSPVHPQIQYVMSFECDPGALNDSNHLLVSGSAVGINPAHIIVEALAGKGFRGAAMPQSEIDETTLESTGQLMASEGLPFNAAALDGITVEKFLDTILVDAGIAMPQIDGRLAFKPVREPSGSVPILTDDEIVSPDIERTVIIGDNPVSQPVFVFKDETDLDYREQDVPRSDDGEASEFGLVTSERTLIPSVTHKDVAARVARRREQETTVRSDIKATVLRGGALLEPGDTFIRQGLGRLRVNSKQWNDQSPEVILSCSLDTLGVPDVGDTIDNGNTGTTEPIGQDIAIKMIQVPEELKQGTSPEVIVMRVRSSEAVYFGNVFLSADGTSYFDTGIQDVAAAGGLLEEGLANSTDDVVVLGPKFAPQNDDYEDLPDLSSDPASFLAGRFLMAINGEVFFVESISAVAESAWQASHSGYDVGDFVQPATGATGFRYKVVADVGNSGGTEPTWPTTLGGQVVDGGITWEAVRFAQRPNNIARANWGTVKGTHAVNDQVYLIDGGDLNRIRSAFFVSGVSLKVKTVVGNTGAATDISGSLVADFTVTDNTDTNEYILAGGAILTTKAADRIITTG